MSRALPARGLLAVLLVLAPLPGCGLQARAKECEEVARALTLAGAGKRRSSSPSLLTATAKEFEAAAERAQKLQGLRPELAPIAQEAATHLRSAAKELRAAARARKSNRAPDYAAARTRSDEARRAMNALAQRYSGVCAR